jgi:hypothetical protein
VTDASEALPILLATPSRPVDEADPFVAKLIEAARRNLANPAAVVATVPTQLVAAAGWCAPFDPNYVVPPPSQPEVPKLACGCPETMLETGRHEPDCLVIGGAVGSGA